MNVLSECIKPLIRQLESKGLTKSEIPGFVWSLKSCLLNKPEMNCYQVNERLRHLGWGDFLLDYHTLELAIACFDADGFNPAEI